MVYQERMEQTFQNVAKKLGMNWHTVERIFYQKACEQFQRDAKQFPQILGVDEISNKNLILLANSDHHMISVDWGERTEVGTGNRPYN